MSFTLFDLLFWGLIGWYAWKTIRKIRRGPDPSMTGEDGRPLTDTQMHYRQQQALMKLDAVGDDPLMQVFSSEQQKIIEAGSYIQENLRPFHWYSWLMTPVDPRLYFRYFLIMSSLAGALIVFPLYMGWPVMTFMVAGFVLFNDLLMDREQRLLEVTKWDPEFRRRFMKD